MKTSADQLLIVFGVLSCKVSAAAIAQFADAVAPHKVLVHHDFSQSPGFHIDHPNVTVLRNPDRTGWGSWSLVSATIKLIEHAMAIDGWDYFQLVSESCLPVRPVRQFADYLVSAKPDVMIDMLPVAADTPAAVMNYGWRYLPRVAALMRVARRSGKWWIGRNYSCKRAYGVNLRIPASAPGGWLDRVKAALGKTMLSAFLSPPVGAFPIGNFRQCWVGSQWFGLSRRAGERLLATKAQFPKLEAHYKRCTIPDESYIHTLVAACAFEKLQPGNHVTFWDAGNFGPDQLTRSDVLRIAQSGKFFARKFALDPECPVRQQVLASVMGAAATSGSGVPATAADPELASPSPGPTR